MNELNPAITVIMPCYNSEFFVKEAIESVLNQTFTDFEFFIFNDASTDGSLKIIKEYSEKDKRIKLFNYEVNQGYVVHLNTGIKEAKGKYIARLDSDDICFPERFETQYNFLEKNPDVALCGSWYESFGAVEPCITEVPSKDIDIRLRFLHHTAIQHPSVMMRTSLLRKYSLNYDVTQMPAEDFVLWVEIAKHSNMFNIALPLIKYRYHDHNISKKAHFGGSFYNVFREAQKNYYKYLFGENTLNKDEWDLLHLFFIKKMDKNIYNIHKIKNILNYILDSYKSDFIPKKDIQEYFKYIYFYLCTSSSSVGWRLIPLYLNSNLIYNDFKLNCKFVVKSLFKLKNRN